MGEDAVDVLDAVGPEARTCLCVGTRLLISRATSQRLQRAGNVSLRPLDGRRLWPHSDNRRQSAHRSEVEWERRLFILTIGQRYEP